METETIYYDAILFGGLLSDTTRTATYKDTRTQNILEKQQNWRMSIVSMSIPTTYIPIRVVEIEKTLTYNPAQLVNMTVYRLSLEYNGLIYEAPLMWIPQTIENWFDRIEVPNVVEQKNILDVAHFSYYSLRNINHFVYILNNALNTAYTEMKTANPGMDANAPPFFIFNGSTSLFTIYVPKSYLTDGVQITFNYKLNRFFEVSFPCFYDADGARFLLNEMTNPINTSTHNGIEYLVQQQTHNTVSKFYTEGGFRTLEVVSETLQVANEVIQNQNGKNGSVQSNGAAFDSILTDFKVGIEDGTELKTTLIYNPTAQYRYLTMTGSGPLKNIEFFIRYKDNFGNEYPLLLPFGECAMIKIVFERIRPD